MSFEEVETDSSFTVSQAARYGQLEPMKKLIDDGHPTDVYDNRGWRAIHEAAYGNYTSCLQTLLALESTEVNWQSFEGQTALFLACQNGYTDSVKVLLEAKADPNIADHTDHYPLHEAVKTKQLPVVEMLVDNGARVDCQMYCGTSPLHTSAAEGMVDLTHYLIEHKASLDIKEDYSVTPVFTAAHFGQEECLELLLKAARNKNQVNLVNYPAEDGATPLYLASQEGHLECVKLLLKYGGDANIMTNKEPTALPVQAALEFAHLDVAAVLLPHTNIELFKDCDCSPWYTVLTQVKDKVKRKSIELLIQNGADVNYRHTKDMEETYTRFPKILRFLPTESMLFLKCITPLTMSVIFEPGKMKSLVIELLLKNGASVNANRLYEFPPLIPALEGGKIKLVRMLIDAGANIDLYHPKLQGNFAFLLCMHQWKSLSLLLKLGADVESMFNEAKYLYHVEETVNCFKPQMNKTEGVDLQTYGNSVDISLHNDAIVKEGATECHTSADNDSVVKGDATECRTSADNDSVVVKEDATECRTSADNDSVVVKEDATECRTSADNDSVVKGDATECRKSVDNDSVIFNEDADQCPTPVCNDSFTDNAKQWDTDSDQEHSQIKILEANSYIPFETFLVAARHVMSAGPYKVNISTVLYKMIYFSTNININEQLWSFFDSQKEITEVKQLTETARPLAHLCRLTVRKRLGTKRLLNEQDTRKEFKLPKNIWDFIFFSEVED